MTFLNQNSALPAHTQAAGPQVYTTCYHPKPSARILVEQCITHSRYLISIDEMNESLKKQETSLERRYLNQITLAEKINQTILELWQPAATQRG